MSMRERIKSSLAHASGSVRVRARLTSQSWCSDLHQIGSRTIERNRRRNRAYFEDFAIEERPKMV